MANFKEIKGFFEDYKFSNEPFKLSECETITNLERFVKTNIKILESNSGKITYLPYFTRLNKIYEHEIQQNNPQN